MTITEAREALSGLNIQTRYSTDSSQDNGVVLEQNIAEGTKLKKGGTIILTVNEIVDEPEEPDEPEGNETVEVNEVVDTNTIT